MWYIMLRKDERNSKNQQKKWFIEIQICSKIKHQVGGDECERRNTKFKD
jgi:hypothetical protein